MAKATQTPIPFMFKNKTKKHWNWECLENRCCGVLLSARGVTARANKKSIWQNERWESWEKFQNIKIHIHMYIQTYTEKIFTNTIYIWFLCVWTYISTHLYNKYMYVITWHVWKLYICMFVHIHISALKILLQNWKINKQIILVL